MRVRARILVIAVTLAVAGCGSGADDQDALAEAQAELAARVDAFCTSSASYVTALDRYGDLINDTAPTVGDVTDAGAELAEPRSDVVAAAEEVASARADVAQAEQELAEARAKASGLPAPSPSGAVPAEPPAGSATVNRVKQADADFTAAQESITDQTPLREASERFNAAAVALEMSWLRLLGDAGCVSEEQYRRARDYTLAVQKSLAEAGYYQREVDGVYGPATVEAVQVLQKAHHLPETGTVDKATDAALQAELRAEGGEELTATAAVQQTLRLAGYWTGPVDGTWTDELTEALRAFQTAVGVEPTGTVDAATVAAVDEARRNRPIPPSASPSG